MPTVRSHGIAIHYEARGEGPAVVLLHSFLCSGSMWDGQVPRLATEWRVVNVDARGHGASGPIPRPFTLYDLVDDVTAVLDELGIDRAFWAGLSIGGMVTLRAALRVPERVAGMILLDTEAGPETFANRLRYRWMGRVASLVGLRPLRRPIARRMFGSTTRSARPELVAAWSESLEQVHVPSALRTLEALLARDDLGPSLERIDVPALVLVGEEDVALPPARSRRLAGALRHGSFGVIEGAGHLSALESPAAVTSAMLGFLRGSRSGSARHPG